MAQLSEMFVLANHPGSNLNGVSSFFKTYVYLIKFNYSYKNAYIHILDLRK